MATQMGASVVAYWIIGYVAYLLPIGAAVSYLSERYPAEGGIYVWTKKAFGDFHGFMAAWFYWTSNLVYFPAALFFVASNTAYLLPGMSHLAEDPLFLGTVSAGFLIAVFLLNVLGLDIAKYFHNFGAFGGFWLPVAVIVGLGMASWWSFGSATSFTLDSMTPRMGSLDDLLLLSVLVYSFAGFEAGSLMGEEIHHPKRNIPRALFASATAMTGAYLLLSISLLLILPANELTGLQGVAESVSRSGVSLLGPWLGQLSSIVILAGIVLCGVGGVSSWLAASSRLPFVIGIDSQLPAAFGRLHPRFHSPYVALLTITALTLLFILMGSLGEKSQQVYDLFISLEITAFFLPYLYMFASLIKLRARDHPGRMSFQIPGRKAGVYAVGVIGILGILLALGLTFVPGEEVEDKSTFWVTVIGVLLANVLTGGVLFWLGQRKSRPSSFSEKEG